MLITQSCIRPWHRILLSVNNNFIFVIVLDSVKEWVVLGPIHKLSVQRVVKIERVEWVYVGVHPVVSLPGHPDVCTALSFDLFLRKDVGALFKRLI